MPGQELVGSRARGRGGNWRGLPISGSQETGSSSSGRIWWVEQRGRGDSLDGEDEEAGVSGLAGWQCPQGGEEVWSHVQGIHRDNSFLLPPQALQFGLDPDLPGKEESDMKLGGFSPSSVSLGLMSPPKAMVNLRPGTSQDPLRGSNPVLVQVHLY